MTTIALRFSDSFSTNKGTLFEHEQILKSNGYVWWGKHGSGINEKTAMNLLSKGPIKIILMRSGTKERYIATVNDIVRKCPEPHLIPEYYRDDKTFYGSFLKITKIERADDNVLNRCFVKSNGRNLGEMINKTMAAYFVIETVEWM